ncbi:hypothetical protein EVA_04675 [gut metagenome]|uniref:Uncharacterized protein n=1 Tax=gut metagenome TaxID=749906 RepID=J9GJ22_9ZZZZ
MTALNLLIASTHDDYEMVWDTSVEFDDQKRLVFRLQKHDYSGYNFQGDYDGKCRHTETKAFLNFETAWQLAQRLHIPTLELPRFFAEKFSPEGDVEKDEVQNIFQQMLNFMLSKGVHYELHRCNEW